MDNMKLAQELEAVEGFKKVFPGFFSGGKAKKSFALYQACSVHGVAKVEVLRRDEHDGNHYAILAFSTQSDLAPSIKDELISQCESIPLGNIRYECLTFSKLENYIGPQIRRHKISIYTLAQQYDDVYLFPIKASKRAIDNYSKIIYAIDEAGEMYVYPL